MVSLLGFLPLLVALALAAVVPLTSVHSGLDTWLTQVSRRYFGRYVPSEAPDRRRRLRSAYVDETYRSYAARTYVITIVAGAAGVIVGVYLFGGLLLALPVVEELVGALPDPMGPILGSVIVDPSLSEQQVLLVVMTGGAVSGTIIAGVVYWLRWELPRSTAEVRRRSINEGLPRTVAFVYALSRGGMEVPKVLRTLARNRAVYGEGANEISVAVRQMDLFGSDMITAVRHVSQRTPSEEFKTFSENLASVLQSGQNISEFLRDQYERHQETAEERQAEILELLSTIAEAYVTVLVAGTLFFMTILLVFGLTTQPTLSFLRLMAYALIPLANLLFIVYLAQKLELLGISRGTDVGALRETIAERSWTPEPETKVADGGYGFATARRQLDRYDSIRRFRTAVSDPVSTVLAAPKRLFYLTVPIALLFVAVRMPAVFNEAGFNLRLFDDVLIRATLFVLATFAVAWEAYTRRIARIEAAMPELLERLASLNEAGMSVVESLDRVREGDLGVLSEEVERIWRDVRYGANVDDAFRRFGLRVRTTSTTRVVTLLTNALTASGSLGPILRVAADQAQSELRLRRKRRQEMLTYLVVIYLSFMVFLVIILAVQEVLVPSLPTNVPTPTAEQTSRLGVDAAQFTRFGKVNTAAYTLVFFHTAMVQAVMSGLIAGQLGEGSVKDGAKHAAIMLGVAYVIFLALSSPSAQITFDDQSVEGRAVVVDSVSLTDGGYVTVRAQAADGEIVGHSDYLAAGSHEDVRVPLDNPPGSERTLYAVPHLDTDGDETFGYTGGLNGTDRPYTTSGEPIFDSASVGSD